MGLRWIDVHAPNGETRGACQVRAKWHYLSVYFASLQMRLAIKARNTVMILVN